MAHVPAPAVPQGRGRIAATLVALVTLYILALDQGQLV